MCGRRSVLRGRVRSAHHRCREHLEAIRVLAELEHPGEAREPQHAQPLRADVRADEVGEQLEVEGRDGRDVDRVHRLDHKRAARAVKRPEPHAVLGREEEGHDHLAPAPKLPVQQRLAVPVLRQRLRDDQADLPAIEQGAAAGRPRVGQRESGGREEGRLGRAGFGTTVFCSTEMQMSTIT
eukprot:3567323-Prymnesium_polylepis.2